MGFIVDYFLRCLREAQDKAKARWCLEEARAMETRLRVNYVVALLGQEHHCMGPLIIVNPMPDYALVVMEGCRDPEGLAYDLAEVLEGLPGAVAVRTRVKDGRVEAEVINWDRVRSTVM